MGIIAENVFSGIADRVARQHEIFEECLNNAQSGTDFYQRIHCGLPCPGDFEVESDLIVPANTSDQAILSQTKFSQIMFSDIVNGLNTHVTTRGGASITSLNDYLNASGTKVHENYGQAYQEITGSSLKAKHVFRKDEVEMAVVSFSASGVGTFTDGTQLNDGTGGDFVDGVSTAAANIKYHVASGLGATDVVLSIIGIDSDGAAVSDNVTIPSTETIGDEAQVGTSEYADITTIQLAGGSASDVVTIRSIIERTITL
jgi:hypothetical protein